MAVEAVVLPHSIMVASRIPGLHHEFVYFSVIFEWHLGKLPVEVLDVSNPGEAHRPTVGRHVQNLLVEGLWPVVDQFEEENALHRPSIFSSVAKVDETFSFKR